MTSKRKSSRKRLEKREMEPEMSDRYQGEDNGRKTGAEWGGAGSRGVRPQEGIQHVPAWKLEGGGLVVGLHLDCGGEALPLTEGDRPRVGWVMRPTGQKPGGLGRGAWDGRVEEPRLRQNSGFRDVGFEGIVQVGLEEKKYYCQEGKLSLLSCWESLS